MVMLIPITHRMRGPWIRVYNYKRQADVMIEGESRGLYIRYKVPLT
jgi:hypothetical protein